ncbi:MAG TPA: GcrA family cell cycle regulator [Phyllobacterium sp.]|nr:GcrA family cell cycle regulator [Phyllobacterium sp.]
MRRAEFHPTQDHLEKVRGWLFDGFSRGQIAAKLGVTKGVVDGLVWRREDLRSISPHAKGFPQHRRSELSLEIKREQQRMKDKQPEPEPVPDTEPEPERPATGVPLKELGHAQCKYPVAWDAEAVGGWLFCGHGTKADQVYCEKHRKITTQAVRQEGARNAKKISEYA